MVERVRYMIKKISSERIRPVALLAGAMVLALFALGVLQAVAVEPAQRGGRGGRGGPQASEESAVALTQRGVELIAEKNLEEALESFDRAIEANQGYGVAHYQRGRTLALMGRMQEAVESLLLSTELQPEFAHGHQLASLAASSSATTRPPGIRPFAPSWPGSNRRRSPASMRYPRRPPRFKSGWPHGGSSWSASTRAN